MFRTRNGLTFFSFEALGNDGRPIQAMSTRTGGVSTDEYHSLNLGFHVDDCHHSVLNNRQLFCQALSLPLESIVTGQQVHGKEVAVIDGSHRGSGAESWTEGIPNTDAMITDSPEVALMVLVADCAAVFLYDPVKEGIGIAHGSWRGTVRQVVPKTVKKMLDAFGSKPEDIQAGISPSIGPCCYRVEEDVLSALRELYPSQWERYIAHQTDGSIHFNLWETLRGQLIETGIQEKKTEVAGICTACHTDLFYSHRREKGRTGRNGAVISLCNLN